MDRGKQVQQHNPNEDQDPIAILLAKLPNMMKQPVQIQWDTTIFGVPQEQIPLYVNLADGLEIVGGSTMLNISIIQLWCM